MIFRYNTAEIKAMVKETNNNWNLYLLYHNSYLFITLGGYNSSHTFPYEMMNENVLLSDYRRSLFMD